MTGVATSPLQVPLEAARPDYNLYRYRHDFYKIVRFKSTAPRLGFSCRDKGDQYKHDDKLPQALSRARRVVKSLALAKRRRTLLVN